MRIGQAKCPHCERTMTTGMFLNHEKYCMDNPDRIDLPKSKPLKTMTLKQMKKYFKLK